MGKSQAVVGGVRRIEESTEVLDEANDEGDDAVEAVEVMESRRISADEAMWMVVACLWIGGGRGPPGRRRVELREEIALRRCSPG
jgi:hypothetical protein